ncbi:heparinase II/III domain-containing protein [Thiorhodococcus fuscus]|uniref:Heparinase II/III family protein n=1 Tax=Thiorhodococcus fuscus TaxID=527200 RepID=A0ABW4YAC6_9GAMM
MARVVSPYYYNEYIDVIDAAASGTFRFFGQTVDFGSPRAIDWHHQVEAESDFHLWRMKLGHMGFICPMLMSGTATHLEAVAQLIASYREQADFGVSGCFSSYWFPYSVSHRILAVLCGYLLARQTRDLPESLCDQIEAFLRWNIGFVLANVEHELKNNHVERNLAALCLYFNCVETVPARLARRLDRDVRDIIKASVLDDGLLAERSAMYQGLTVMALHIFAETEFLTTATRQLASERYQQAVRAWRFMTHPDGEIALFNDSWFGEVPPPSTIAAKQDFGPLERLPTAGYARLEAGAFFALFDAGPIGPRWNPGHGHADFLAIELDVVGKRFIVDPGTYQYSTGPRRRFERSADSHNGPALEGREPVEYKGCFRVGRMASAQLTGHTMEETGGRVSGALQLPGVRFQRELQLSTRGLRCTDDWIGATNGAKVRLIVPGTWSVTSWNPIQASFKSDETRVHITVHEGSLVGVEPGCWSRHYLQNEDAMVLILKPRQTDERSAQLIWAVDQAT